MGVRAAGKKFQIYFVLFCKFLVNWGKNMHTFYQLGKKYEFPPLFSFPFYHFFFPNMLFSHIFAEKYTPLLLLLFQCLRLLISTKKIIVAISQFFYFFFYENYLYYIYLHIYLYVISIFYLLKAVCLHVLVSIQRVADTVLNYRSM